MLEKFAGAVITLSHSPKHDDLTDLLFIKNIQSADEISHSANEQKSFLVTFEHDVDQKQLNSIADFIKRVVDIAGLIGVPATQISEENLHKTKCDLITLSSAARPKAAGVLEGEDLKNHVREIKKWHIVNRRMIASLAGPTRVT